MDGGGALPSLGRVSAVLEWVACRGLGRAGEESRGGSEKRHLPIRSHPSAPSLNLINSPPPPPTHTPQVPDVQQFMADYNMQCPMAAKRLIYSGLPATVEHGKPR